MGGLAGINHGDGQAHVPATMGTNIQGQAFQLLAVLTAELLNPLGFIHALNQALELEA